MANYEMEVNLPSDGKFYEDRISKLTIRNLTTDEEMKIYGSTSTTVVDRVINSCIIEPKGFDCGTLIPADKFYLMIQLRINTYGSMYKQESYCPRCEREGIFELDLDRLECDYLPENFKIPLKLRLPISKDVIELKILNTNRYNSIKERAEKIAKNTGGKVEEIEYKLKLAAQIKSINDKEVDTFEAENYVKGLHGRDSQTINSAIKSIKVGYSGIANIVCPHCHKEFQAPFIMNSEFFRPTLDVEWL